MECTRACLNKSDLSMYPTKSMLDYMNEMDRLFPRTSENDIFQTSLHHAAQSPFNLSTPVNRSSSSADSTSPDSFPDMSARSDTARASDTSYDTPFVARRQRPIVGRRIMTNNPPTPERPNSVRSFDHDIEFPNILQHDDSLFFAQTPPNFRQNDIYELFPAENRGFEFKSPVNTTALLSNVSPTLSNISSTVSNFSPTMSNFSPNLSNVAGNPKVVPVAQYQSPASYSDQMFGASSSKYHDNIRPKMCTFCRKNGETPLVYMTHTVKQKVGNKDIVSCPILRSHVCSTCGASGDDAHTITYCPVLRRNNNGQPLQSTTITLKNTRVKSNGRRRY